MMARTKHTRRITLMDTCYLQRMGRSPLNGGYSCNVSTLSSKSGSSVRRSNAKIVELLLFFFLSRWCLSILILPETGIEGEHTCGGGAYFSCCSTLEAMQRRLTY
ncbi:uncharacterized protein G2W53_004803 [Senna tora]|uniref:Uncharacterized protein n=1 Tax=Senna tora TaxID=362788 RepID=A0A835CJN3_9FABA|nr:uncharacterized protein G2W53_004803 [Senna tora]